MPIEETPVQRFDIFADYHQVYLEDEKSQADEEGDHAERVQRLDAWIAQLLNKAAFERHLGVMPGVICILTARAMTVPVAVEILTEAPTADFTDWDRVVEASLEVSSGCLVIHGPTDYFPAAPRISLAPGTYRVRVSFGGLGTVTPDELEGADHYCVALWPALEASPAVLFVREG
jgi:hypothetical protein